MKLLLIEDDEFFRKFYSFKLQEKGIEVDLAADGEEGIQKLQTTTPDVVLLDIIMPKKNGFEVLEAKQAMSDKKDIPVIVFSTLGQDEDVKKAMGLGASDFMNKSFFDFDNLLQKIQSKAKS